MRSTRSTGSANNSRPSRTASSLWELFAESMTISMAADAVGVRGTSCATMSPTCAVKATRSMIPTKVAFPQLFVPTAGEQEGVAEPAHSLLPGREALALRKMLQRPRPLLGSGEVER